MPAGMRDRLLREFALWEFAHRQIRDLENEQERLLRDGTEPWLEKIRRLIGLKAIGVRSAWMFVQEIFGWRQIKNGKELAALAGLTPTPYSSGKSEREQGISKAGQSSRARDDGRDRLALAALATAKPPESVVPKAVRVGKQSRSQGGDRGVGSEASDRFVALRGPRRAAEGG